VRRKRPAPISRTSEIATCSTSSALPSRLREATTLRLLSFKAALTLIRVARSAGMMPKTTPVIVVTTITKSSTCQSSS
jgi:hypothetical protein